MNEEKIKKIKDRKGEEGAALVMVLLISFLLLVASAGILLETSLNSANVTDSTAEQQAYNAAESGLQSAVNVLRGNSEYQKTSGDKITFSKAITLSKSNYSGDTSTTPRLSKWMTYDYPSTNPDRITLGATTAVPYTTQGGFAYSVALLDPDNVGGSISYSTSGKIGGVANVNRFPAIGSDYVEIKYNPVSATTITFPLDPMIIPKLGSFTVTVAGSGGTIPSGTLFQVSVKMTAPYTGTAIIRGTIDPGAITSASTVSLTFDSPVNILAGSTITLNIPSNRVFPLVTNGDKELTGSFTPAEPTRLLIRSTGFGPRGARKVLEAIVQKDFFNGLSAPATLTLVGSTNGFNFDPGTSNNITYSGDDVVSTVNIPSIGTTNDANLAAVLTELNKNNVKTVPNPPPTNVFDELPEWLQNPYNLDVEIQRLRLLAKSSPGRYFPNATQTQPDKNDFGDVTTGTGITFVDGNVDLTGQGVGILVCTGKLTLDGAVDFKGLIIVTGVDGIVRKGTGNGVLQGNTVVAPYNPADIINPNITAQFLGPKYNLSGGGNSTIQYNSSSVDNGLNAVSNFVLGVAEK